LIIELSIYIYIYIGLIRKDPFGWN